MFDRILNNPSVVSHYSRTFRYIIVDIYFKNIRIEYKKNDFVTYCVTIHANLLGQTFRKKNCL